MAYATKKQAVGVSTLETLSYPHIKKGLIVCPMLDARNRRVFAAAYEDGDEVVKEDNYLITEFLGKLDDYLILNKIKNADLLFCVDTGEKYRNDEEIKIILSKVKENNLVKDIKFIYTDPNASDIAQIAYYKIQNTKDSKALFSPLTLKPNYICASSAERMKKK